MHQTNYIERNTIDQLKDYIKNLFERETAINVVVNKTRTKTENHDVKIKGVYQNFFTVHNSRLSVNFTIQYVDVITGVIVINEI